MRYTKIKIGTAVVAGIAALALAGCGSTSGTTAPQSSSPGSPAAAATRSVSYTAAQQTFINDLSSQYNLGGGTASDNANAVGLGNYVCSGFQSGESVSSVDSAVQQAQTPSISASEAAGIVSLAGQDLCPQTAQAKAAAAAVKAAAAKAAAAQAAAAQAAAAKAAAARAARIAAENTPISSDQWGRVLRNPDNYVGDIYTISGTVSEYNINSNTFASNANAALVATDANGNSFVVEADSSLLGNVQPGQTFSAKVTVEGVDQSQNTVSGGTGEIPDFLASTFTVTG
jgi:multidrug efflux pump subunit AcrA (membrane-fusion protein)